MQADRLMQFCRPLKRFPQNRFAQYRDAVVRNTCRPRPAQPFHIHQFPSLHAHSHVGAGMNMNPRRFPFFQDIGERFRIIHGRLRIRHQHDGSKTALRRRGRSAFDIFLIGKTGIPKMNMHIHKPRRNDLPGRINMFYLFRPGNA